LHTRILNLRKFIALPLMVATMVVGLGGVAVASTSSAIVAPFASDQIVINGTCSSAQVMAMAAQAMSLYAPGDQPAGVIVNGQWLPAGMGANSSAFVTSSGCAVALLETDQIVLNGVCLSPNLVIATAREAMSLYAWGSQPAGVIVNGIWEPAAQAADLGVSISNGCSVQT
jgi:hypothetical protein